MMKRLLATVCLGLALPAQAQEQEPNNSFAEATALAPGDVLSGEITANDNDFYVFTTGGTSTIDVWASALPGSQTLDTVMHFYRADQTQIAENDDRGGNAEGLYSGHRLANAPPATYYVKIRGYTGFGAPRTGHYRMHLTLSGGPDMRVSAFALNPQPAPGQTWGASVTVNNGVDASPATITRLYNGEAMIAEHQTPIIAANGNTQAVFANLAALEIGYHNLRVCTDAGEVVQELDETNNCATIQATVGLDLVAQSMTVTPNPPTVGQTWATSATLRNALAGELPATTATLTLNGVESGTCEVPVIANGGNHVCNFTELAGLPSGITVVRICADSGAAVEEAAEDNNCAERTIAIGSDLIAENLVLDPVNPGLGDTFSATVRIRNRFAPDTPESVARISLGDQAWGECQVPALAAEAHHDCQLNNLQAPPAGRLLVRFCADADEIWGERNEDNNCAESNIFNGPDLQIQQVILNPNPPVEGRAAQALVIVRNAVADPVTEITQLRVSENGQALGSPCTVAPIAGNGIGACQINGLQFAGGAHTISICADVANEQVEINEDNNCHEMQFTVEDVDVYEPDNDRLSATLMRAGDSQDHSLHNNDDLDYMFFVVNRPSEAQIHTSAVQEGDNFDTRVALVDDNGQDITSNDDGGEGNFSRVVRELQPGTYYLRVNRGGNAAVDRYRITLRLIDLAARPPDLSPGVLGLDPVVLLAGQSFTLTSTISNAANAGVSQGSTAALTIDGNAAGECSIAELASDASAPCTIIVPGGAPAGDVVLRLCVDPNNAMEERDENNNCRQLSLHLYALDEYEVDNSREEASDLALDEAQVHTLHVADDVDWVRITMLEPGSLSVTTSLGEGSGGDVDGRLTAPGGETLDRSTGLGDVELAYGPADRGVFYVEITSRGNAPVDGYTITATHTAVEGEVIRDIRLVNLTSNPDDPAPDTAYELTVFAANDGNLISSATTVALSIDGEEVTRCVLPPAEPGATMRCRDVEMPGLSEGNYQLTACIDPDGELGESEAAQENNCATIDITVGEPAAAQNDLRLQNAQLNPAAPLAGEMITLRMEVFYSGDSSTTATTVDVRVDGETVHTCQIPSLDGRMVRTARCRTLPGMLQMGDEPQLVLACVDPGNSIEETDEDNNCLRLVMAPGGFIGGEADAYEVDNDWANAGTLNDAEALNRAQAHNLHLAGDVDVMKFNLTQDDRINLRLGSVMGALSVTLVDGPPQPGDAGSRMASELTFDDEGLAATDELSAGVYAFEVRSADGFAVAMYTINAWSDLGPVQPDAGPAPPDAGPPGECQSNDDCTGGQRCVVDDPEPYCTNACESVRDCPEGFQLTCREIAAGTKACIRGEAPPTLAPPKPGQGCSCASGGGVGLLGLLGFVGLFLRRRRRRMPYQD
jgi:MYXO-CTERM domain-containing protein